MTAAVALPGISMGATPIDSEDINVDYKHVFYDEQDDRSTVNAN